jgi:hypothetical protein
VRKWYWVAILPAPGGGKGSGVPPPFFLPSPFPPASYPTPEQWLGFATLKEARRVAHFLLHAPIERVNRYIGETFPALLRAGEVAYRREV